MKETKNIVAYLFVFIICILVILLILSGVSSRDMLVRINRKEGIREKYRFVNLRSDKNIVAYTMNSCGACPSQKLNVSHYDKTAPSYFSDSIGTSFFIINIPPLSISDTVDAVVNETGFFSERNVLDPLITVDLLKTTSFLDFWIKGKDEYGPTFNPDTYVLKSVYGYEISKTFTDSIPPAIEFSYLGGTCASTGLPIRNMWQGYVVDIDYGNEFDGVSSYSLTVQGPKDIPLAYYRSYLYSHEEPTNSEPHFHLAPRLDNTNIQNLNPKTGSGTCYDFWGIKITRTTSVNPAQTGGTVVYTPMPSQGVNLTQTNNSPPSGGSGDKAPYSAGTPISQDNKNMNKMANNETMDDSIDAVLSILGAAVGSVCTIS